MHVQSPAQLCWGPGCPGGFTKGVWPGLLEPLEMTTWKPPQWQVLWGSGRAPPPSVLLPEGGGRCLSKGICPGLSLPPGAPGQHTRSEGTKEVGREGATSRKIFF